MDRHELRPMIFSGANAVGRGQEMKMNRDILKVWIINSGVLGYATVAEAEAVLKVALLAATLLYTLIKCWKLVRQKGSDDTIQFRKD